MNRRNVSIREFCKDLWFPPAPTVRSTLPKRETPVRPDAWSRSALHEATSARFVLFFTGRKPADRKRRSARLHRWSWAFRKAAAARRMERFGLDVRKGDCGSCGEPYDRAEGGFQCPCQRDGHATDACLFGPCVCIRRVMRNARKAERHAC